MSRRDLLMAMLGKTTKLPDILPAEYQEVEYIRSTGAQYIDTGYQPENGCALEISFSVSRKYNYYCLFSSGSNNPQLVLLLGAQTSYYKYMTSADAENITYNYDINTKYNLTVNSNGTLSIFNSQYSSTYQAQPDTNLLLLERANHTAHFEGNLYSCKIWNNGTLVRNFVPCYRKSDNVIGLYDLINGVFYTNQGTGTFIKGNNV